MEEHQRQLKRIKDEATSDGSDSNPDQENDSHDEWEGFEEPPAVDYEAEYIDEDKYTTVTVEEMDPSREGLRKSVREEGSEQEEDDDEEDPSTTTTEPESKPAKVTRKQTGDKPKKKKQFRYESKQDRKLNLAKQRLSKSKKAKARREK